MADSIYSNRDPSYKDYSSNNNGVNSSTQAFSRSNSRLGLSSVLVPIYQFNQYYQQYGSKNIRLLFPRRSAKEVGQNQGRYTKSKVSFETYREIRGMIQEPGK